MKNIVVFENTIYRKNLGWKLFWFCQRRHPALFRFVPLMLWHSFLYAFHICDEKKYLEKLFAFMAFTTDFEALVKAFWAKKRIKQLKQVQNPIYITMYPKQAMEGLSAKLSAPILGNGTGVGHKSLLELAAIGAEGEAATYYDKNSSALAKLSGGSFLPVLDRRVYRSRGACRAIWWLKAAFTAVALTGLAVAVSMAALFFGASSFRLSMFISYFQIKPLALLNILPAVWLIYLLYFITNRVWLSFTLTSAVTLVGSLVNYFKIMLRNDPLIAEDVINYAEGMNMAGRYNIVFDLWIWLALIGTIVAIVCSALMVRSRVRSGKVRVAAAVALILLGVFGMKTIYFDANIYAAAKNEAEIRIWSPTDTYISKGFWYPFLHSFKSAVDTPPNGYNESSAAALLSNYAYDDIPEEKKVNVIAIMLEAFGDFSDFDMLTFEKDIYAPWNKLCAEGVSGRLVTDIFAAGTVATERQFLTGFANLPSLRTPTNSYARYFADQGYTVEGSHTCYDWFYNRKNINENLGFENYYFYENMYSDLSGGGIGLDNIIMPQILNLYEQGKAKDKPYFSFNVTYQNHGPYERNALYYDPIVRADGQSVESYNILNNYFGGIDSTIKQIELMINKLRQQEEPVVVVLFGDHMPWLGDNNSVYNELGISLDLSTEEGFYNYYTTPYVIWANDSAKKATGTDFSGDGGDIGPYFLMNKVFEAAGFGGNQFMKMTNDLLAQMDYVSVTGKCGKDGKFMPQLPPQARTALDNYLNIEYYQKKHLSK